MQALCFLQSQSYRRDCTFFFLGHWLLTVVLLTGPTGFHKNQEITQIAEDESFFSDVSCLMHFCCFRFCELYRSALL